MSKVVRKEKKFYTIIKNACNDKNAFSHKISDSIGYDPVRKKSIKSKKPYDIIMTYIGCNFHTEVKYEPKEKAFSVKQLRESQIEALDKISANQNQYTIPLVVLGIYRPREIKRMYFFHYDWLLENPLKKADVLALENYLDIRKETFDLDEMMTIIYGWKQTDEKKRSRIEKKIMEIRQEFDNVIEVSRVATMTETIVNKLTEMKKLFKEVSE